MPVCVCMYVYVCVCASACVCACVRDSVKHWRSCVNERPRGCRKRCPGPRDRRYNNAWKGLRSTASTASRRSYRCQRWANIPAGFKACPPCPGLARRVRVDDIACDINAAAHVDIVPERAYAFEGRFLTRREGRVGSEGGDESAVCLSHQRTAASPHKVVIGSSEQGPLLSSSS